MDVLHVGWQVDNNYFLKFGSPLLKSVLYFEAVNYTIKWKTKNTTLSEQFQNLMANSTTPLTHKYTTAHFTDFSTGTLA